MHTVDFYLLKYFYSKKSYDFESTQKSGKSYCTRKCSSQKMARNVRYVFFFPLFFFFFFFPIFSFSLFLFATLSNITSNINILGVVSKVPVLLKQKRTNLLVPCLLCFEREEMYLFLTEKNAKFVLSAFTHPFISLFNFKFYFFF